MAERTFLINYPSSLKTHWKQQKTPKEENIISNETRKEPQPQTAKYEDYLPNTEELWSKKKMLRDDQNKKTKNLLRPQTLVRLQIVKSILVLKVHSNNPLTTVMRFKEMSKHKRYHYS